MSRSTRLMAATAGWLGAGLLVLAPCVAQEVREFDRNQDGKLDRGEIAEIFRAVNSYNRGTGEDPLPGEPTAPGGAPAAQVHCKKCGGTKPATACPAAAVGQVVIQPGQALVPATRVEPLRIQAVEVKSAELKPVVQVKPVEIRRVEINPVEIKPVEIRPAASVPAADPARPVPPAPVPAPAAVPTPVQAADGATTSRTLTVQPGSTLRATGQGTLGIPSTPGVPGTPGRPGQAAGSLTLYTSESGGQKWVHADPGREEIRCQLLEQLQETRNRVIEHLSMLAEAYRDKGELPKTEEVTNRIVQLELRFAGAIAGARQGPIDNVVAEVRGQLATAEAGRWSSSGAMTATSAGGDPRVGGLEMQVRSLSAQLDQLRQRTEVVQHMLEELHDRRSAPPVAQPQPPQPVQPPRAVGPGEEARALRARLETRAAEVRKQMEDTVARLRKIKDRLESGDLSGKDRKQAKAEAEEVEARMRALQEEHKAIEMKLREIDGPKGEGPKRHPKSLFLVGQATAE